MAVYVGENKAVVYHGDSHPLNVYQGKRKITGYNTPTLTGKGRVEFESPYNAALPSVVVRGEGRQEKMEGKNLIDFPDMDFSDAIQNVSAKLDLTGTFTLFYKVEEKTPPTSGAAFFQIRIDGRNVYTAYNKPKTVTGHITEIIFINWAEVSGRIYNVQLEEGSTPTPYEPYCGGIPAPNPQYPIEPVFLEGVEIAARGRNLFDSSCLIKDNGGQYYSLKDSDVYIRQNDTRGFGEMKSSRMYIPSNTAVIFSSDFNPFEFQMNNIDTGEEVRVYMMKMRHYARIKSGGLFAIKIQAAGVEYPYKVGRIHMEIGSTPTPYTPYYDGGTAPLPILRALPDGSVRDEIDLRTGTVTRRIWEEVYDGSPDEAWYVKSHTTVPNGWLCGLRVPTEHPAYASKYYLPISNICEGVINQYAALIPNSFNIDGYSQLNASFETNGNPVSDIQALRDLLSSTPMIIWYALATPIIEHYDPAILRQHPGYTQLIQQGGFTEAEIEATVYQKMEG